MRRTILATLPVLAILSVATGCGRDDSPHSPATSSPAADASIAVGTDPIGITATGTGEVWVAVAGDDKVVRVAGAGGGSTAISVPGTPLRLRATRDGAALWATTFRNGSVVRVDPATGRITDEVPVGAGAEGVTEAFGSIWVAAQDAGLLTQVDPGRRTVRHKVDVGSGVRLVVAGAGALWLADHASGELVRVDPKTYRLRRADRVCDGPEDLVASGTTIWVTCSTGEELVAVRTTDLVVTSRVALDGTPDAITAAPDGSLLVALQDGPTLVRLDGATGAELSRTRLGKQEQLHDQANLDIAVTGDDAWITSPGNDRVLRTPWRG
jgi:streptogramin lyase